MKGLLRRISEEFRDARQSTLTRAQAASCGTSDGNRIRSGVRSQAGDEDVLERGQDGSRGFDGKPRRAQAASELALPAVGVPAADPSARLNSRNSASDVHTGMSTVSLASTA